MKRFFILLLLSLPCVALWASNIRKSVSQVAEGVDLTEDVDYHITSATPFTDEGFVNIVNTDHAVIIFDNVKPSLALKLLSHVFINGEAAKSESNCQVRLYNRGAILYPYGKESTSENGFHPLTVYAEQNCTGESYERFALESSGGYMNTLTAAKLNNRIRSFVLKRGYMVTFSLRAEGRGYSRCFIADKEDLVMNTLPSLMDNRISSYRIFRWYDTSKSGLANSTNYEATQALNVTSCYSFGLGETRLPDAECVPHHIYEDWPSSSACGGVNFSPHMKTNNEPGNSADDHPQTVDQILANWENLMRTGMRLCSPSSHDGSLNHLRAFMDSIDARGWRCDIIDLHCYWAEGSFSTWSFYDQWANRYGRPIWISEWVWGASWNSNGAFAGNVTEAQNRDAIKRITEKLNGWDCIERYYYWNSERDPSRIYKNGKLTPAGEYYASMNTGLGYCNYGKYIPKTPRMVSITDLAVTFNAKTNKGELTWTNANGDLTEMSVLQKKVNNVWTTLDTIPQSDENAQTYAIELDGADAFGLHEYRIMNLDVDNKRRYSNIASVFVGGAEDLGDIMVGRIEVTNSDLSTIYFSKQETAPMVFTGIPSNANNSNGLVNHLTAISKESFKFFFDPWTAGTAMEITKTESTDFILLHPGRGTWGTMQYEADTCKYENASGAISKMSRGDTIEVTFKEPFTEIPVVLVQNLYAASNKTPTFARVFDVTTKGFKMRLLKQEDVSTAIVNQYCFYLAVTPGTASIGDTGKRISAGIADNPTGGAGTIQNYFLSPTGDTLYFENPYIIAGAQTHFLDVPSVMRKASNITQSVTAEDGTTRLLTYGMRVKRQTDATSTIPTGMNTASKSGDLMGWIVIDNDRTGSSISTPASSHSKLFVEVRGRHIYPSDPAARIYTAAGTRVRSGQQLLPGLYIVSNNRESVKLMLR